MKCPQCQTTLKMTDRKGIEIDYCPSCRGIWLDRGELDKIIERSAADAVVDVSPRPSGVSGHERKREYEARPRKKKSFWGELLDFDFD
ncbi:zf-TFIIB domain-containing protein [Planctomycetaceae bacterium SH139]